MSVLSYKIIAMISIMLLFVKNLSFKIHFDSFHLIHNTVALKYENEPQLLLLGVKYYFVIVYRKT